MLVSTFVLANIIAGARTLARTGFGIPLIGAYFTEGDANQKVFAFSAIEEVEDLGITDGWLHSTLQTAFSQEPRTEQIKVGRIGTFTHTLQITPSNTTAGFVYAGTLNDIAWSYTNGSSETVATVIDGIIAELDPIANTTLVDSTTHFTLAHAVAGELHRFDCVSGGLAVSDVTTQSDIASDLSAIRDADPNFYGVAVAPESKSVIDAVAAWAEARDVLFGATTCDTNVLVTGSSDVASVARDNERAHTFIGWHDQSGTAYSFLLQVRTLNYDPGSETWEFKDVKGIRPARVDTTQQGFADAKNVNVYVDVTAPGTSTGVGQNHGAKVAVGEWIDTVRSNAWLNINIAIDIYEHLRSRPKIAFTQADINGIIDIAKRRLTNAVDRGILSAGTPGDPEDPVPFVFPVPISSTTQEDRRGRLLRKIQYRARYAGAIHFVKPVTGFISY